MQQGVIRPIDADSLALASSIIRSGGLIVLPTDTVYGVACDPFNPDAIARIFAVKHRPHAKSLQVLLDAVGRIDDLGVDLPSPLDRLAARLLPGAFSPIGVARQDCRLATLRDEGTAPDGSPLRTQAIRVPDSQATRAVLHATGPLAATSANTSGRPSAPSAQEAYAQLGDAIRLYLDAGPTPGPVASTVVAANRRAGGVTVLREGVIPERVIRRLIAEDEGHAAHGRDGDGPLA